MGIEPTSEGWEVLNISIPFSSQRLLPTPAREISIEDKRGRYHRGSTDPEMTGLAKS